MASSFDPHVDYTAKMTTFNMEQYWAIENFTLYQLGPNLSYKPLVSKVYYAPEHDLQYQLFLYPNGTNENPYSMQVLPVAGLQVKSISGEGNGSSSKKSSYWKEDAMIIIDYSFRSVEGVNKISKDDVNWKHKCSIKINSPSLAQTEHQIDRYKRMLGSFKINSNGQMMLQCKINISYPTDSFAGIFCSSLPVIEMVRKGDHFEKMKALLETGANSDIKLVVEDQEFKVHKFLLSTHSAVFATMFSHKNTKEAIEKRVIIEDVSAKTILTLLYYIYTGTVKNKNELSAELFLQLTSTR